MQASMIDGYPDGWSGPAGIPVCVLGAAGASQPENNNVKSSRDGALMKERDYIGVGLAATSEQGLLHSPNASALPSQDKTEGDNVELSLGLGLPKKATDQLVPHAEQQLLSPGLRPDYAEAQTKSRLAFGAKSQHFWHHSFRMNLSNNHYQQHATAQAEANNGASSLKNYSSTVPTWGMVPGLFAVPVPKVSTVRAKRSYLETVGERRPLPVGATHVATIETPAHCVMPTSMGAYSWNAEGAVSLGGGWQQGHGSIDQGSNYVTGGGGSSAPFAHRLGQLGAVSPPLLSPLFKIQTPVSSGALLPATGNSSMGFNTGATSPAAEGSAKPEMENDDIRNKAPLVGWPPVRSFRKNILQATQTNRPSSEDLLMKSARGPSNGGVDGQEPSANNSKNALFVKAKLDGVRICRKVDLKAYGSYEELKSVLRDMFQGFVSDNTKLDLLHGNNYVVTHEDKDGDCLLVGDVPWPMFLESSVKSLRIMKAKDAIGIGDKVPAKLKAQANGGKP